MFREFCLAAARSPAIIDLVMLPQGLHSVPAELRTRLQVEVDKLDLGPEHVTAEHNAAVPPPKYDAILLGYALCSNGVVGVTSRRVPLVIPRGHDCVTLLLGSKEAYQEYFDTHRGIYWYSSGWIERTLQPGRERWERTFAHYAETYGEENAEFLMEMEQNWFKEYSWATYINWDLPTADTDRAYTRACADFLHWNYDELPGDPSLLYDFADGNWDAERFLTIAPGSCIEPSHDPGIMKACAGCPVHGAAQCTENRAAEMNGLRR